MNQFLKNFLQAICFFSLALVTTSCHKHTDKEQDLQDAITNTLTVSEYLIDCRDGIMVEPNQEVKITIIGLKVFDVNHTELGLEKINLYLGDNYMETEELRMGDHIHLTFKIGNDFHGKYPLSFGLTTSNQIKTTIKSDFAFLVFNEKPVIDINYRLYLALEAHATNGENFLWEHFFTYTSPIFDLYKLNINWIPSNGKAPLWNMGVTLSPFVNEETSNCEATINVNKSIWDNESTVIGDGKVVFSGYGEYFNENLGDHTAQLYTTISGTKESIQFEYSSIIGIALLTVDPNKQ